MEKNNNFYRRRISKKAIGGLTIVCFVILIVILIGIAVWQLGILDNGFGSIISLRSADKIDSNVFSFAGEPMLAEDSTDVMSAYGFTGMQIKEFKINEDTRTELDFKSPDYDLETEFKMLPYSAVEQDIYITNNKLTTETFNYSTIIKIDYGEVTWNGTKYILGKTPQKFTTTTHYDIASDSIETIAPQIWFDDVYYKRINYKDLARKGGYAIAYESGGEYFIELKMDELSLDSKEKYYIDPVFYNDTDGFLMADLAGGDANLANSKGIASNDTDLWLGANANAFINHFKWNGATWINASDGFTNSKTGQGLAREESDGSFWIADYVTDEIKHINSVGGSIADFACSGVLGNINCLALDTNSSAPNGDIWVGTYTNNFVYHAIDGVNQSDGFDYTTITGASNSIYGLAMNGTDFWIQDIVTDFVYHIDENRNNMTDGFSLLTLTGGGAFEGGLTTNGSDLFVTEYTDKFIYHLNPNFTAPITTPNVTLVTPTNQSNSSTSSVDFNCSFTSGTLVTNISLFHNYTAWGINQTNSTINVLSNSTIFTTPFPDGTYLWNCEACNDAGCSQDNNNQTFRVDTTSPTINITDPTNNSFHTTNTTDINYTTFDIGIDSCWYSNGTYGVNTTLTGCANITIINWTDGLNNVTIWVNDSVGNINSSFVFWTIDTLTPNVTIINPINNSNITDNQTIVNYSISEPNLDSCWYSNGTYATNTTLTSCANISGVTWVDGFNNITIWVNDTSNNIGSAFVFFNVTRVVSSYDYNTTTYETANETFILNISSALSSTSTANFWYAGTSYTGTKTGDNSDALFKYSLDVPIGLTNNSHYWEVSFGGTPNFNTTTVNQSVEETNFSLCGEDGGSQKFLNFSFKDESTGLYLTNGSIPTSTFEYYLGSGVLNKSLTFINNTANPSFTFCAVPVDRNLTIDYTIQYENSASSYPQRLFNPDAIGFTNATTNVTLWLLPSTDGIYVTFQVINVAEQSISGVVVTGTRIIGGSTVTIATGTTDAAGSVTFFLDSDFSHTFTFVSTDYDTYTTSIFPTQSSYTVTLGGASSTVDDFYNGITSEINPTFKSLSGSPYTGLQNDTAYDFGINLTSTVWEVTEFGFYLFNSSNVVVASDVAFTNGGVTTTNYNVGSTTAWLRMDYYWVIDGNYTNSSVSWYVFNSGGTEWSISNFFTDFTSYTNSSSPEGAIFGLDEFGRGLIVFLIIFLFVGIMSYKFGLVSYAGIASITFLIVAFFDTVLDIVPNPVGAIPNFPTVFMGLIMLSILIKEVWR